MQRLCFLAAGNDWSRFRLLRQSGGRAGELCWYAERLNFNFFSKIFPKIFRKIFFKNFLQKNFAEIFYLIKDFLSDRFVTIYWIRRGVGNFTRTGLVGAAFRASPVRGAIRTVIVLVDWTRRASLQQLDELVQKHATFLKNDFK